LQFQSMNFAGNDRLLNTFIGAPPSLSLPLPLSLSLSLSLSVFLSVRRWSTQVPHRLADTPTL
jgi:hypothetical protein